MRLVLLADLRVETLLRGPLGDSGFDVETVRSPDALNEACGVAPVPSVVIASLPPSLGVADFLRTYRMGVGTGGPPVILILPAGTAVEVQLLAESGVADICVAPFQGGRLVRRIKEIADGRRSMPPPARSVSASTPSPIRAPESPAAMEAKPTDGTAKESAGSERHTPTPAPERTPTPSAELSDLLGVDIEMPSLPGKTIDLSNIGNRSAEPAPARRLKSEPPEPAPPTATPSPGAPPTTDAKKEPAGGATRWPEALPSIEICISLLVALTMNQLLPEGTDELTLSATWKSLTTSDIAALRSIADRTPDLSATDDPSVALARLAADQLRLRIAVTQAERLLAAAQKVKVDETFVAQWRLQIDRDIREVLDPALQRAVEEGDLARMKDFRTAREAISTRRSELDRVASRLRGVTQEKVAAALLDRDAPTPQTAHRPRGRIETRVLQITTVTAQNVRRYAPLLIGIMVITGTISLLLHAFVFDTFNIKHRPQMVEQNSSILGVDRIEYRPHLAVVMVNGAFDREKGVRELAHVVHPGDRRVVGLE